ncbi:MAG TPA: hypothetical protein VF039_01555 [Longimicrobiales bacterium]
MSETKEAIERRTDAAFAASVWQDPRAEYRALLKRLREHDSALFEEAVRAYESTVAGRLAEDERADPVGAWIEYGRSLAQLAGGGRIVAIDSDGRATEAPTGSLSATLLLQLPTDESVPAFVVAAPRETSAAQRATAALLAAGAQALPG